MRNSVPPPEIEYIENLFAPEDALLAEIRDECERSGKGGMQIRPYEGKILRLLLKLVRARKVLEVGTFMGYSTVWLARALPEDGMLYTLEQNPEYIARAKAFFSRGGLSGKIVLVEGKAEESLADVEVFAPFDVIFVDANKSAYKLYLDWAMKCVRTGGLIVGDNTLLFGKVFASEPPESVSRAQWANMRAFNKTLAESEEFESVLIPTAEGLTVAMKK